MAAACWAQRQPGNPGPKAQWDPARLKALQQIMPLTTAVREDDHPAVAARGGRVVGGMGFVFRDRRHQPGLRALVSKTASGPRRCR